MKKIVALMIIVPAIAFAGKAEREFKTTKIDPAVKEAQASFKKCGCAINITFAPEILSSEANMRQVLFMVEDVTQGSAKYCTDAASKAAVCKMKSLEIKHGATSGFEFKNGHGVATTDGQMNPSFDAMTAKLDT